MNPFQVLIDREDDIQCIAKHFGSDAQRAKTIEELSEAAQELSKELVRRLDHWTPFTFDSLAELADVLVMIAQISYFAELEVPDDHVIASTINAKIDRTLIRIKEGYYRTEEKSTTELYQTAVEALQEIMSSPEGFKDILRMYFNAVSPDMSPDTLDATLEHTSEFAPSFDFEDGSSIKITFSRYPSDDEEKED